MTVNYEEIDPGIRRLVELLNDYDITVANSGDGVSKHPDKRVTDSPHVFCHVNEYETLEETVDYITKLLREHGVEFTESVEVEGYYAGSTGVQTVLVRGVADPMLKFDERREAYIQGYMTALLDQDSMVEQPRRVAADEWERYLAREAKKILERHFDANKEEGTDG